MRVTILYVWSTLLQYGPCEIFRHRQTAVQPKYCISLISICVEAPAAALACNAREWGATAIGEGVGGSVPAVSESVPMALTVAGEDGVAEEWESASGRTVWIHAHESVCIVHVCHCLSMFVPCTSVFTCFSSMFFSVFP